MFRLRASSNIAILALLLGACGGGGGDSMGPDGSISDVDGGIGTDSSAPPTVTVHVANQNGPAAGAELHISGADGAFLRLEATGDDGSAVLTDVPAGASITAVIPADDVSAQTLFTYEDVQAGDDLLFSMGPQAVTPAKAGNLDLTIVDDGDVGDEYVVRAPCDALPFANEVSNHDQTFANVCLSKDGGLDLLIEAYSGGVLAGYASFPSIALAGAEPNLTGSLTASSWTESIANYGFTVTNDSISEGTFEVSAEMLHEGSVYHREGGDIVVAAEDETLFASPWFSAGFYDRAVVGMKQEKKYSISQTLVGGAAPTTIEVPFALNDTDLFGNVTSGLNLVDSSLQLTHPDPGACRGGETADAVIALFVMSAGNGDPQDYNWVVVGASDGNYSMPDLDPSVTASLWPIAEIQSADALFQVIGDSTRDWDAIRNSKHNLPAPAQAVYEGTGDQTLCLSLAVAAYPSI